MIACRNRYSREVWLCGALGLVISLAGCSHPQTPEVSEASPKAAEPVKAAVSGPAIEPRFRQAFLDAVTIEPPEGEERPPDKTVAGKVVGKMFEDIAGSDGKPGVWDQVPLVTSDGKRVHYSAVVKTDQGSFTIDLLSDAAPNHVRNFIALAKVGYYDGLGFDRTVRQKIEAEGSSVPFEMLEAGCPLGTGEPGYGSLGYWLKPEIGDKLTHDVGMVGACHGEELESAGAKFYITVSKAPWLDGNWTIFGKVTQGLDVARTILERPTTAEDPARPQDPVRIREVVIQSRVEN